MEFKKIYSYTARFIIIPLIIFGMVYHTRSDLFWYLLRLFDYPVEYVIHILVALVFLIGIVTFIVVYMITKHLLVSVAATIITVIIGLLPLPVTFVIWVMGSCVQPVRLRMTAAKQTRAEYQRRTATLKQKLEHWQSAGYAVSELKRTMGINNIDQMEQKFREAEQKIGRLKKAENTLNKVLQDFPQEKIVFEWEITAITMKLKDLSQADETERNARDLAKRISEYGRAKGEIIDMIDTVVNEGRA